MTPLFLLVLLASPANAQSASQMMAAAQPDLPDLEIELVVDGNSDLRESAKKALLNLEKTLAEEWLKLGAGVNEQILAQEQAVKAAKSAGKSAEHADGNVALLMQARANLAAGPPTYRLEVGSQGSVILVEGIPAVPWVAVSPQKLTPGESCPDVDRLNELLAQVAVFRREMNGVVPAGQDGAMLEVGKGGPAIFGLVHNGKFGGSVRVNGQLTKYDYAAACGSATTPDAKALTDFFNAARSIRKP